MGLPIRTTVDDIESLCKYLATKPTGATIQEAKAVLDSKYLDARKLSAMKFWGLIEDQERLKLTADGRMVTKDKKNILSKIIKSIAPYKAIVERAVYRKEESLTATEVAAHWHDHFPEESGIQIKF